MRREHTHKDSQSGLTGPEPGLNSHKQRETMRTAHRKVDPNPHPACQEQVEIKCHLRHEVHGGSNMTTVSFRATGFSPAPQNSLSLETFKHNQTGCTLWVCESLGRSSSRSHACFNSSPLRIKEVSSLLPRSHSFWPILSSPWLSSAAKAVRKKGDKIAILWQ